LPVTCQVVNIGVMAMEHQASPLDLEASLAFVNTLEHSAHGDRDDLPTLEAAAEWLLERGALGATGARAVMAAPRPDARLTAVHGLRSALREIVDAIAAGRPPAADALEEANRYLASAPRPRLVARPDGVGTERGGGRDPLREALGLLVEPLTQVLVEGRPERVRVCANDHCRWVFYDTSPTGRRRWCDMSTCGNRAKVARHRARQRSKATG
jgi:predicted RNA-binding Zn ribbon-like protein